LGACALKRNGKKKKVIRSTDFMSGFEAPNIRNRKARTLAAGLSNLNLITNRQRMPALIELQSS